MPKPKTIEEYVAAKPKALQPKVKEMIACIRKAAPGAEEGLKWSMPSFSYRRILVVFATYAHHIGFYPTPSAMRAFQKELKKYKTGRGSVQFPHDKPLPKALIAKITKFRVMESLKDDAKWRSSKPKKR